MSCDYCGKRIMFWHFNVQFKDKFYHGNCILNTDEHDKIIYKNKQDGERR